MKTLYISDLDGTLLNKEANITEFSVSTINRLISKGMNFTIATARSYSSALSIIKKLNINLPIIVYNGTFIVNSKTGTIIYKNIFTKDEIEIVKKVMYKNNVTPMVYALIDEKEKVSIYNFNLNEGTREYIKSRSSDPRINLINDESLLYRGEIYYFTIIGDYEYLKPIYDYLKLNLKCTITFQKEIYRDEYWLEIMPESASKGLATLKLKNILEMDKVIVFGDAINDLGMFNVANECYAMDNAVDSLKQIATNVIESNDNDGVAKWLETNYIYFESK